MSRSPGDKATDRRRLSRLVQADSHLTA